MSQTGWEADKMLDVYIYDYLVKRKLYATAKTFKAEGKVSTEPVAIDAPGGFLFEWWSVFWDIFIARTNEKQSEAASSYIENQMIKARELHDQKHQKPQQQQQLLVQRHAQQKQQQLHQRDGSQHLNTTANRLVGSNSLAKQNFATDLVANMYKDRLKLPLQRDTFEDAIMQQRMSDSVGQLVDPTHASMSKSPSLGGQSSGEILLGAHRGVLGNLQTQNQQLVSAKDINNEMTSMMSPRAVRPQGSLIGVPGSNQGGNNLTLKGWPLAGLDQLRSGILQQHKPLMQSPQSYNQLQLQQQLMLQAQQNLTSPSANDLDYRKLQMLLSNRNMSFTKDVHVNSAGDVIPNFGSPMQVPALPFEATDIIYKLQQQQLENNNQQQQQYLQQSLSGRSQNLNHHVQQQDKMVLSGSITADSMSNGFQGNEQTSKGQIGRKRKQPVSSSGPANSLGTANTTEPLPSSPVTTSTHTPGDVISMPTFQHMFVSDGVGSLTSASNQLADMDHLVSDGALEDNVESFLSHDADDAETTDRVGSFTDVSKGVTFTEIQLIPASTSKIESCHFSSDGKLLATGGHDKKANLWCTESFTVKSTLEEHSHWITDVRFSPTISRLATSSADKTVRIWDPDRPGYSLRTFTGHSTTVMSLDFHPSKEDLICSCDIGSEIRYWSIKNSSCAGVFKGGASELRFQPRIGRFLAAAAGNSVTVLDVETQVCRHKLQGHKNHIHSVCWDSSGDYLASVSDDMVRIWAVSSSSKGDYIHELSCNGNKFSTCIFHPSYPSLLVIGCYETLELWNFAENKTMTVHAHDKLISSLAVSSVNGLIASASHDKCVKVWK